LILIKKGLKIEKQLLKNDIFIYIHLDFFIFSIFLSQPESFSLKGKN